MPRSRLIVLYNGKRGLLPDVSYMHFADIYEELDEKENGLVPDQDFLITVININKGHNEDIKRKCPTLGEYSIFVATARRNKNQGMTLEKALTRAVKECIYRGILAKFLTKYKLEVINMFATEWKLEEALEVVKEEGIEEGEMRVKMEVLSLMEQGYSIDEIKAKLKPQ
jgi:hypothetical protein